MTSLTTSGKRLWAIDSSNNQLLTYYDGLAERVEPYSPEDDAVKCGVFKNEEVKGVSLCWLPLNGTTCYQWQIDTDTDFSSIENGLEGDCMDIAVSMDTLEPATRYYWRVRASSPLYSYWSETYCFNTSTEAIPAAPKLAYPSNGAVKITLEPTFQWLAVANAETYELQLSEDVLFDNLLTTPEESFGLTTTTYRNNKNLQESSRIFKNLQPITGE